MQVLQDGLIKADRARPWQSQADLGTTCKDTVYLTADGTGTAGGLCQGEDIDSNTPVGNPQSRTFSSCDWLQQVKNRGQVSTRS